jgi:hypothetical protein
MRTNIQLLIILLAFALSKTASVCGQNYNVIVYQPPSGFVETQGEGIAGQQRVGAARIEGGVYPEYTHALLWLGNSTTPIDLHPSQWSYSRASATDGTHQVGYVEGQTSSYSGRYAALWSGTSDSIVILPPFDIGAYSEALSIAGNEIVGYNDYSFNGGAGDGGGGTTYIIHAALWNVSSANLIDLHPNLPGANSPGDQRSKAYDTDGAYQVGWTNFYVPQSDGNFSSETRAMLWHGTSESAVILHPPNWDVSYAYGVKNGTQVGYGIQNVDMGGVMALVWHGSAETLTILGEGTALDTNGATHVGSISVGYSSHAFRWDGDTGTGVDLHNLLPAGYINSGATDIDDAGNIIGWAQLQSGYLNAVLWSVVATNSPPTVSVTNPLPKSKHTTNELLTLVASAKDSDGNVSRVEFFVDGMSVGIASQRNAKGSFSVQWRPTQNGICRIQAKATDNGGATTMSQTVMIAVSNATGRL